MHRQRGASFLAWVSGIGIVILLFITMVKLVPVYLEFYAVRSMVDDIAADPRMSRASTKEVRRTVDDYLNVNGMYTLSNEAFAVKSVAGDDVRELQVYYEVRKHWLANIDFLTTFEYSKELGKAGDT